MFNVFARIKGLYLLSKFKRLKQVVSILLLASFITVNFSKVIIWTEYQLNKTEITQKYCVNKDKPNMHCCGKCHLKKQLALDEEKQKSPAMPDVKNDIQLFGTNTIISIHHIDGASSELNSLYSDGVLIGVHSSVFRPPLV